MPPYVIGESRGGEDAVIVQLNPGDRPVVVSDLDPVSDPHGMAFNCLESDMLLVTRHPTGQLPYTERTTPVAIITPEGHEPLSEVLHTEVPVAQGMGIISVRYVAAPVSTDVDPRSFTLPE